MKDERGNESGAVVKFQAPEEPEHDRPLSLEEQRSLAGAAPLVSPEERLDTELPSRGWANAAIPRTAFVAGLMGTFCFLAFASTMLFSGRRKAAEAPVPEPEAIAVTPNQSDQLKTQLALVGQGQDQAKPSPSRDRPVRPPVPTKTTPRPAPARPSPSPPIPARTLPISAPTRPEAQTPEPEIDPFEQWNALASVGTMRDDMESQPVAQVAAERQTEPIAEVRVASATLGAGSLPLMRGDRSPPMAPAETIETGREFSPLSPGATGILQRRRATSAEATNQAAIPLGAVAEGKVMVPLFWTGDSNTQSAIELKEALKDAEGGEVLPAGTVFITEITNVDEESRLIEQTAIAILYERGGQQVQEPIPPGLVLILDKDLEPLKGDRVRSRRGFNLERSLGRVIGAAENELGRDDITDRAASGVLGGLAEQVRQSDRGSNRPGNSTALTLKVGRTVSVLVNGFLGVNR
jgi:hypothetical protein